MNPMFASKLVTSIRVVTPCYNLAVNQQLLCDHDGSNSINIFIFIYFTINSFATKFFFVLLKLQ